MFWNIYERMSWYLTQGVEGGEKKSREQLEAEKRAILKQRIQPLEIDGFDSSKLAEKARELHAQVYRLESEKYDLERRFKSQLNDVSSMCVHARLPLYINVLLYIKSVYIYIYIYIYTKWCSWIFQMLELAERARNMNKVG